MLAVIVIRYGENGVSYNRGHTLKGKRIARDEDDQPMYVPAEMNYRDWKAVYVEKTQTLDGWKASRKAVALSGADGIIKSKSEELEKEKEEYRKKQESLPKTFEEWPDLDKELDIEKCAFYANYLYRGDEKGDGNCQRAVVAYDMLRKGKKAVAQRIYGTWAEDPLVKSFDKAYVPSKVFDGLPGNGKKSLEKLLLKDWGDGARAIVNVHWNDRDYAHTFIVENVKGKLVYIDPQSGTIGAEVEAFLEKAKEGTTDVMRVDNVKFEDSYLRKSCEILEI